MTDSVSAVSGLTRYTDSYGRTDGRTNEEGGYSSTSILQLGDAREKIGLGGVS